MENLVQLVTPVQLDQQVHRAIQGHREIKEIRDHREIKAILVELVLQEIRDLKVIREHREIGDKLVHREIKATLVELDHRDQEVFRV